MSTSPPRADWPIASNDVPKITAPPGKPVVVRSTELTDDGYEVITETVAFTRVVSVRQVAARASSTNSDSLPASERPNPVLDHSIFSHIFDTIVSFASPEALLKLRGTSRGVRDLVDTFLFRHVVVDKRGALRARHGRVWIREPWTDKRLANTIVIDLPAQPRQNLMEEFYDEESFRFPKLSLVRLQGCTDEDYPDALQRLISIFDFDELGDHPWLVSCFDLTVHHPDDSARSYSPRPLWLRTHKCFFPRVKACVVNIRYSAFHRRFGESDLRNFLFERRKNEPVYYYVLFTCVEGPPSDTRERPLPPPVRTRMLNDLLRSIFLAGELEVYLVDVDSWDHSWLNRHYWSCDRTWFHEETTPTATLTERLEWWIKKMATHFHQSEAEARKKAISRITYLTTLQFQEELSKACKADMYDLIVQP